MNYISTTALKILMPEQMMNYFKNGKERCTVIRENLLRKIAILQGILETRNLSQYCKGRISTNIKALQEQLVALDTDGEVIMIQQIKTCAI